MMSTTKKPTVLYLAKTFPIGPDPWANQRLGEDTPQKFEMVCQVSAWLPWVNGFQFLIPSVSDSVNHGELKSLGKGEIGLPDRASDVSGVIRCH